MKKISFIDEEKLLKHQLQQQIQKCSICGYEYYTKDFRVCKKCKKEHCLRCTIIAGKLGAICKKCFDTLPSEEKTEISKIATRLRFWAKNGYYAFIGIVLLTVISFGLSLMDFIFFYLALIFVVFGIIYGFWLFKYLTQ